MVVKKYIMRSYVTTDHNSPVLRYVVANNDTGTIVQMGMQCDEAEKLRDEMNENVRKLNQQSAREEQAAAPTVVPAPAYPAQPPRATKYGAANETAADAVMKALRSQGPYAKMSILAICLMRLQYENRLRLMDHK